jgi:hypothetical protein
MNRSGGGGQELVRSPSGRSPSGRSSSGSVRSPSGVGKGDILA